ncbi:MAG TPA: hypothetical protein VKW06_09210 [Candidatus Angelobacter sp.]|nr:hypothetical protein [Candidatus Angelobacter sp.]
MCFVLYAGTEKPIPRREWQEDKPNLSVLALSEREIPIAVHFSMPEVQYIGSTSQCGCDFPHVTLQGGSWPWFETDSDAEQEESESYNRKALVDLLRKAGDKTVELYGLWDETSLKSRPSAKPFHWKGFSAPIFASKSKASIPSRWAVSEPAPGAQASRFSIPRDNKGRGDPVIGKPGDLKTSLPQAHSERSDG